MAKSPKAPFGVPVIGGQQAGPLPVEERMLLGMFSNINSAMSHMAQGIASLNVRIDELTSVTRLQTLIMAKDGELPVDLGLFVRVANNIMHPHLWGLVMESNVEEEKKLEPADLRALYVAQVTGWAKSVGLKTKIYGEFQVRDLDELRKKLEEQQTKAKEVTPKDDEVSEQERGD
jgi:hypothetical protein